MIKFLFNVLLIVGVVFITELLTYKYIRKIDKKERTNLQEWELEYLQKLKKEELDK